MPSYQARLSTVNTHSKHFTMYLEEMWQTGYHQLLTSIFEGEGGDLNFLLSHHIFLIYTLNLDQFKGGCCTGTN